MLVPESQLERAVEYYRRQFDVDPKPVADGGHGFALRSFELRVAVRPCSPEPSYTRGQTPRLELQVDDVDVAARSWVAGGARLRCCMDRTGSEAMDGAATYAHVIDPFGHLWALSLRSLDHGQ